MIKGIFLKFRGIGLAVFCPRFELGRALGLVMFHNVPH